MEHLRWIRCIRIFVIYFWIDWVLLPIYVRWIYLRYQKKCVWFAFRMRKISILTWQETLVPGLCPRIFFFFEANGINSVLKVLLCCLFISNYLSFTSALPNVGEFLSPVVLVSFVRSRIICFKNPHLLVCSIFVFYLFNFNLFRIILSQIV